jgi:hypothetical protein
MKLHFSKEQEKQYIKIPFNVPVGMERVDIISQYDTSSNATLDLALLGTDGNRLGAAGSARNHVWVSALGSCTGFETQDPEPGQWHILAGLYRIPPEGVDVTYEIAFTPKTRRLFKGDTHLHTTASDGKSDLGSLIVLACEQGLDFIFITDHNSTAQNALTGPYPNLTVLPGVEWTHFNGHALFLGADNPLKGDFGVDDWGKGKILVQQAREAEAFTAIAHPFCPVVPWVWGLDEGHLAPFNGMEIWNGIMHERNERAIHFWHTLLCKGIRLPAIGGSDYHAPGLFGSLGTPCQNVYAPSRSPKDILTALKNGNGFISYLPNGPEVDFFNNNRGVLGETVAPGEPLSVTFAGLHAGDEIRLVTNTDAENIPVTAPGRLGLERRYGHCAFVRAEVYRTYAPGLPPMKALVSNPVYFA